jgi:hypothetical protein
MSSSGNDMELELQIVGGKSVEKPFWWPNSLEKRKWRGDRCVLIGLILVWGLYAAGVSISFWIVPWILGYVGVGRRSGTGCSRYSLYFTKLWTHY